MKGCDVMGRYATNRYELRKGDSLLYTGTTAEIAKFLGIPLKQVHTLKTPSYLRNMKEHGGSNFRYLVRCIPDVARSLEIMVYK